MKRIMCVVGTRPEAIKMAPVIKALMEASWAEPVVVSTGQHREILKQILGYFQIAADIELDVMTPNQSLTDLSAMLISRLDSVINEQRPDLVIAQGDTTTVFIASLVCFYRKIPFAHVEAGLRTGDMFSPFPEEMNRVLTGKLATLHFAPTERARERLLADNIADSSILVTGNTVIDALLEVSPKARGHFNDLPPDKHMILVTAHRRESFGEPFQRILAAIRELATTRDDLLFIYPVHPNPNVRGPAEQALSELSNVRLVEPLDYLAFVEAMKRCHLILTDSGGVQEEAPALGKPVLVLRDNTERPEALEFGVVRLVGSDKDRIVAETTRLLDDPDAYREMAVGASPYGDGHAAGRIANRIEGYLHSAG